jgi:class 3 adenylate cyclase
MRDLPRGTVTFLFTDVEGSTRLLKQLGERYGDVLAEHQRLLRAAFEEAGGQEIDTQGDSFFVAFPRAREAVQAAVAGQRALASHRWPEGAAVRVRMGLHTGEPTVGEERYVGMGVHKAARIASAAHGGQILLSNTTRGLVEDDLPADIRLADLGEHPLKDIDLPERLFQLNAEGLPHRFPPLRTDAPLPQARRWRRPARISRERALIAAAAALIIAAIIVGIAVAMGRHEANPSGETGISTRSEPLTAPGNDPNQIRIGRAIGAVELGMSESDVKARYGAGIQSQWHKRGRGGERILYPGDRGSLTVSFYDGKVAQIMTSSPYYSTDNGVHVGVTAPFPPDPVSRERALARHELEEVAPGTFAWKDFVFDNQSFSYCLRDDRSATQLVFGGLASTHITVVSITDGRLLAYLPVIKIPFAAAPVAELYCSAEPLQP